MIFKDIYKFLPERELWQFLADYRHSSAGFTWFFDGFGHRCNTFLPQSVTAPYTQSLISHHNGNNHPGEPITSPWIFPESGDFDILNEFSDRLCSGGYLQMKLHRKWWDVGQMWEKCSNEKRITHWHSISYPLIFVIRAEMNGQNMTKTHLIYMERKVWKIVTDIAMEFWLLLFFVGQF